MRDARHLTLAAAARRRRRSAGASAAAAKHSKVALVACDTVADTATFRGTHDADAQGRDAAAALHPAGARRRAAAAAARRRAGRRPSTRGCPARPARRATSTTRPSRTSRTAPSYRAVVRFRWRDADGHIVARAIKATPACKQPDPRPNLKVEARHGAARARRRDAHLRASRSSTAAPASAPAFATGLDVNGAPLADQPPGPLAPRATTHVSLRRAGVRRGLDADRDGRTRRRPSTSATRPTTRSPCPARRAAAVTVEPSLD